MIGRLSRARIWSSRVFVAIVIVAAVAKEHVFEAFVPFKAEDSALTPQESSLGQPQTPTGDGVAPPAKVQGSTTAPQKSMSVQNPAQVNENVTQSTLPRAERIANDLLLVVALIFLYAMLELSAELSIVGIRPLRKLAMGRFDIEDDWLDIVFQSDQIVGGGLVQILFEGNEYKLDGRDFSSRKTWTGWFASEMSRYEGRTLDFKYRALRPGKLEDNTGHGEYNFSGGFGRGLTHYSGHFYEDRNQKRFYVYGERLSSYLPDKKERAKLTQPDQLPQLVAKFIEDRRGVMPIVENALSDGVYPFPQTGSPAA